MFHGSKRKAMSAATVALAGLMMGPLAREAGAAEACEWYTIASISSGNTPTTVTTRGITHGPTYAISPQFTYDVLPGTAYIHHRPDNLDHPEDHFLWAYYRTSLSVPARRSSYVRQRRLTVQVHGDNYVDVYLPQLYGSTPVLQQARTDQELNFQNPPDAFVDDFFSFQAATYDVMLDLYNFTGPMALDYRITVEEQECRCLRFPGDPACIE